MELPRDFIKLHFPGRSFGFCAFLIHLGDALVIHSDSGNVFWDCFYISIKVPSIWRLWEREGTHKRERQVLLFLMHSSRLGFKWEQKHLNQTRIPALELPWKITCFPRSGIFDHHLFNLSLSSFGVFFFSFFFLFLHPPPFFFVHSWISVLGKCLDVGERI